jgi:hypothetical protein
MLGEHTINNKGYDEKCQQYYAGIFTEGLNYVLLYFY